MFQRKKLDNSVAAGSDIKLANQLTHEADVVGEVRDDQLLGALSDFDRGLVRKHRFDLVAKFRGRNILELKDFHQTLASLWQRRASVVDDFGGEFRILSLGQNEDRLARLNRSKTFQCKRPIDEVDRIAHRKFPGADDRQLALDLFVFYDALARRFGEPLNDHVNIRALEADLQFFRWRRDIGGEFPGSPWLSRRGGAGIRGNRGGGCRRRRVLRGCGQYAQEDEAIS